MAQIADSMIASGVTVLAIVNLDNASGAASSRRPRSRASRRIDYDRLTLGGFGAVLRLVRQHQGRPAPGRGLQNCLGKDKKANIVFLDGSPDDSNATAFAKGAHSVLDANKNYTKVAEQAVPKWDNKTAGTILV